MTDILDIRGLAISLPSEKGEVRPVESLSLAVRDGEAVALVGESGCGKSLTALAALRLLPPPLKMSGGSVWFEGRDMGKLGEKELCGIRGARMAMVFQEPVAALNPVMTVGFQIAEALRAHKQLSWREARARSMELLAEVRLPDPSRIMDSYPHQLSGGMCQRALLAMALSCRPSLLIADEPTTALDVTVQAQLLDLLDHLREAFGLAVLLITHDLAVVARFAQRAYVMYSGRIVEEAPVRELFKRPLHPYTRGLMQSVPRRGAKGRLKAIPGAVPPPGMRPPGCAFGPRCALFRAECQASVPDLLAVEPLHLVRCPFGMGEQ
jgi:oligopeptide/dipeptide ABC transporter ATP-binding protein